MARWLSSSAGGDVRFDTTQWSLISAAGPDNPEGRAALEDLYQHYCHPVYCFVRQWGYPHQDAQDITQDFFIYLVEKKVFNRATTSQGKFRTFLLRSLKFFLQHLNARARTQKRGGQAKLIFLDDAEEAYRLVDPSLTAEQIFDTQWVIKLVEGALNRLQAELEQSGKRELFDQLSEFLLGGEESSYLEVSQRTGLSIAATRAAIYRLRVRYRELLRAEIARTVASSADFDAEMMALQSLLPAAPPG
jgi:DNA-directed RNA polymerase specialized sigma24 family protein